jgi:hypothetical protein
VPCRNLPVKADQGADVKVGRERCSRVTVCPVPTFPFEEISQTLVIMLLSRMLRLIRRECGCRAWSGETNV